MMTCENEVAPAAQREPGAAVRCPFERLVDLVARLRNPDTGCPWDRAQNHDSLRPYVIEEAYEAVLAIERGSAEDLADELGDLMLQVVLHSQIASEAGAFTVDDVIDSLCEKLIRRHPHVFSDVTAEKNIPEIRASWHEIKRDEEGRIRSPHLPVLLRARKFVDEHSVVSENDAEKSSPEEKAGLGVLRSVRDCWKAGFDAELALARALSALENEQDGREAPA